MTPIHRHFAWALLTAAAGPLAVAGGAYAGEHPSPAEILPDLDQAAPSQLEIQGQMGDWRLGFAARADNVGQGILEIRGARTPGDTGPMAATQAIQMSDGSTTLLPGVGELKYVTAFGHAHWHFTNFARYELRSAAEPTALVNDVKTGFCLVDAFPNGNCGSQQPGLDSMVMGIRPGGNDIYAPQVDGQYIPIAPQTTPAGDYLLIHRANASGQLREVTDANNVASARVRLSWSGAGVPSGSILSRCSSTATCAAPPAPSGGDPPPPAPSPGDAPAEDPPAGQAQPPAPEPIIPIVSGPSTAKLRLPAMTRAEAAGLARDAVRRGLKRSPKAFKAECSPRRTTAWSCRASWKLRSTTRWSGRIGVWYAVDGRAVRWFYNLSATEKPSGRSVKRASAKGAVHPG